MKSGWYVLECLDNGTLKVVSRRFTFHKECEERMEEIKDLLLETPEGELETEYLVAQLWGFRRQNARSSNSESSGT